jgi:hypothetical protein
MPAPAYYRGRPARFWIAIMSGPAPAAAANQAAATSPASQRPAAAAARRRTPGETTSPVSTAAGASAWEAWAGNWFTPHRQPDRLSAASSGTCSTTPRPATATSDLTGTPGTPTAAAKPATPDDSSRPSATTSSSPCGRTPPELGVSDNRIAVTAARAPLATGPPGHARNRDHVRRLRWLFLGQTALY